MSSTTVDITDKKQFSHKVNDFQHLLKYDSDTYNGISFTDDIAFVYFPDGWYIMDRNLEEKINNSPFRMDEINLFVISAFLLVKNGRNTQDDIYGSKELLTSYTIASDIIRIGDLSLYQAYIDSVLPLFYQIMEESNV